MGERYLCDGMFKLNVIIVMPNNNNASVYLLESANIWHDKLGYVNFDTLRRVINLELIPKCNVDSSNKCEICVESKLTITPFHSVEISTTPLDLIHIDICDLKYVQMRGGKKYFITFIDDCTRYCYIYLLKSKYKALEVFKHFKNEVENQLSKKIKR